MVYNIPMNGITVPNIFTFARISIIPFIIIVFYLPVKHNHIIAAMIFIVAASTDWLDGYLARKLHQCSSLGKFLDPVADKLLVAVALVMLVSLHASPLLTVPAAIIVCREITISALREWMAEIGKNTHVSVSYVGKVKTTIQMFAIILLLSQPPDLHNKIVILGYILLYLALILTIWSMCIYLLAARKVLVN